MAARSGKQQSSSTAFSKAESPLLRAPDVLPNITFPGLSPDSQRDITGDRGAGGRGRCPHQPPRPRVGDGLTDGFPAEPRTGAGGIRA